MSAQRELADLGEAPLLDPWTEERKRRPGMPLVRVIDLAKDVQAFLEPREFLRMAPGERSFSLLSEPGEGLTWIGYKPGQMPLSNEEYDALIREYDDVWRSQQ